MSARKIVVMGVAGSGKSTIGANLAQRLKAEFIDGDELHSVESVAKMSKGVPLQDADRWPWLRKVGAVLHDTEGDCIIGCSALKRVYRDLIRETAQDPVTFVHLHGSQAVLAARMSDRPGHFMPSSLLDSQLEALEPLGEDENPIHIDIDQPVDAIVASVVAAL